MMNKYTNIHFAPLNKDTQPLKLKALIMSLLSPVLDIQKRHAVVRIISLSILLINIEVQVNTQEIGLSISTGIVTKFFTNLF